MKTAVYANYKLTDI